MKRLKERSEPMTPVEAGAISLLRAVSRYQPPPGMKQRVRARLLAAGNPTAARLFGPALTIALLSLAAGASAALGYAWIARHDATAQHSRPSDALAGSVLQPAKTRAPNAPEREATAAVASSVTDATAAPRASESPVDPKSELQRPASSQPRSDPGRANAAPSEQVKLVFDSMRALRRDGQPERASKLLDEYLRRYPGGALAEEALALSIEAATMRSDPRARDLANRYLARYPNGQFRKAAERARARFAP